VVEPWIHGAGMYQRTCKQASRHHEGNAERHLADHEGVSKA
jgi:hypothetical protein